MRSFCALLVAVSQPVCSETRATGPVTSLPLPRYVSLKASEGNVRRGPSLTHRIDWVFKRRNMPLRSPATGAGSKTRTGLAAGFTIR